jgi:hypothetical protein
MARACVNVALLLAVCCGAAGATGSGRVHGASLLRSFRR